MTMPRGVRKCGEGVFALALSLLLWRLTGSFVGWLVMFAPATAVTVYGLYRIFLMDDAP